MHTGTRIGADEVVKHDLTRYNLGRLCIEQQDHYPDIDTWHAHLVNRGLKVLLYLYEDRITRTGMVGRLWLFYKA